MKPRGQNGQFAKGNAGGPGRPKRETEANYLAALTAGVSEEAWSDIVLRAVEDAKQGDARARDWLSRYLVGERSAVDAIDQPQSRIVFYAPDNGRRMD